MDKYEIEITFTEDLLGTVPKDKEIYTNFIQSKAPNHEDDELETVEELEDKSTGFHMLEGNPILYDYVVKGFLKDACGSLRRVKGTKSEKLTSYKKIIDGLVFVYPRMIPIKLSGAMATLERPLRASTAKGERVTLAKSDTCPAGSKIKLTLEVIGAVSKKQLIEWLDYGARRGLGQWRNASYGRFVYAIK